MTKEGRSMDMGGKKINGRNDRAEEAVTETSPVRRNTMAAIDEIASREANAVMPHRLILPLAAS